MLIVALRWLDSWDRSVRLGNRLPPALDDEALLAGDRLREEYKELVEAAV